MFRILAIAASLLGAASAAHADVYRWVDAQGTVKYSDTWVPGSVLVKTDRKSAGEPPDSDTTSEEGSSPTTTDAGASRADEIIAEQQNRRIVEQDVAKARAEQCQKATAAYERAITHRRLYSEGEGGTRNYMSDAEADAYRVKLLAARKEACGS